MLVKVARAFITSRLAVSVYFCTWLGRSWTSADTLGSAINQTSTSANVIRIVTSKTARDRVIPRAMTMSTKGERI